MMKYGLSHIYHEYQHMDPHSNNILSGYQPLQVLSYQLATFKQIKWDLSIGILAQPKDSLAQMDTWTTCSCMQYVHVEPAVF